MVPSTRRYEVVRKERWQSTLKRGQDRVTGGREGSANLNTLFWAYTVRSESSCALRLRYVDLVVIIEVAVEVCCCFSVFSG
jgi:hypothetical protein